MTTLSALSSAFSSSFYATNRLSALYADSGDRVSSALRQPSEALSREIESTRVQLSSLGQVQSATAGLQSAAIKLRDLPESAVVGEAKKAAEAFVQAYNDQRTALAGAGGDVARRGSAQAIGATGVDGRVAVAASQASRLTGDQGTALREAGIRVERDGSLSVDAKALESAFNANPKAVTQALGQVGRAAEAMTTRQLSENGSVGAAVRTLENRTQQLENRQSLVENASVAAQRALESSSRRYGFGAVGAGAYLGIFGL